MRLPVLLLVLAAVPACRDREASEREPSPSRLLHSSPPPSESRPLRQGFTQRPPPSTPGLPPPDAALLTEQQIDALEAGERAPSLEARQRAEGELVALIEKLETIGADRGAVELSALVSEARKRAAAHAAEARVDYLTAEGLHREYLFPNDVDSAGDRYRGRVVVLTGTVAPHNMLDLADGFKLFERTPYAHDPVLLATEYELSFVRCHLARSDLQKLRDWQEIHLLGIVEGKSRGDVVLRRCVVL